MPVDLPFANLPPHRRRELLSYILAERARGAAAVGPMSHGQRSLWYVQQLWPGSAAWNFSVAARSRGGLDPVALRRALQSLVDRHAAFRTTFTAWDGVPLQRVQDHLTQELHEIDASGWSADQLHAALVSEAHRPFDLERGPLVRARLYRDAAGDHVFLLAVHHIVYDVVSLVILLDELRIVYDAARSGTPAALPDLTATYADFVRWEAAMLAGAEGERHWAYWEQELAPPVPVLDLPADRPRPPHETFAGAVHPFTIGEDVTSRLRALASEEGVTLYTLLLSAFFVLLHRYSGQDDLIVGSPMASRTRAEFAGIIGYFINPVCLRADCSGNPTFRSFLAGVRRVVLGALDHQAFPFPLLVERLHAERERSRSPLFQVMFNMPKAHRLEEQGISRFVLGEAGAVMRLGDRELELFPVEQQVVMFDLLFGMVDGGGALSASVQYRTDLYDFPTVARMADHLRVLLDEIVSDPDRRIQDMSLLPERERERSARVPAPAEPAVAGVTERFSAEVRRRPDAVAVARGEDQLTYRELHERVGSLAGALSAHGVEHGSVVPVLADRGIDLVAAILALHSAGAAYLPVEPGNPEVRTADALTSSGAPLVLVGGTQERALEAALLTMDRDARPRVFQLDAIGQRVARPDALVRPGDLAYVIHTSGTTGKPKGAMVHHDALLNHLDALTADLGLSEHDVVAQTASQAFDISVWQLLGAVLLGGRVQVMEDEIAHDPRRLLIEADRTGVTVLETVPAMLELMLDEIAERDAPLPATLRWMISTGEDLPVDLARRWFEVSPVPLVNAYGPAECADDVAYHILRSPPPEAVRVPIGRPIMNTRVDVLDGRLNAVPVGAVGELCVGGRAVGLGYLGDAAATAQAFVPDPLGPKGHRIYRTGDLGRVRGDGTIEFLGRRDHQVKLRGRRIELGEVESVLRTHAAVREVVATVRESASGDPHLVAHIVPAQGANIGERELLQFLRDRLPQYLVPSAVVVLGELPRHPSGKVDRRRLPGPQWDANDSGRSAAPQLSAAEARVAAVWRQVLQRGSFGPRDDFFTVGGHSLQAVQIVTRLRADWEVELPLRAFMEDPTIAGLAARLTGTASPSQGGGVTGAELLEEATLEPDIAPARRNGRSMDGVVLTGATGFLGAFLLHALVQSTPEKITCLVRAHDEKGAFERLREALTRYGLWGDELAARVRPIPGDLGRPRFGLDDDDFNALGRAQAIFHGGAEVNFLRSYSALKRVNVDGTREVLRLACRGDASTVHLVSTISVLGQGDPPGSRLREDASLHGVDGLLDGYSQSKWVAEALALEAASRGLDVSVYRPGRITGHSETGVTTADDLLLGVLAVCVRLGRVPDLDVPVDMTPVDHVSKAIVFLSCERDLSSPVHLANPRPARWPQVVEWLRSFGYALEVDPAEQWLDFVATSLAHGADASLQTLFHLMDSRRDQPVVPEVDCRTATELLAGTGIECPPADEALVHTYLQWLVDHEVLPPPDRRVPVG